MAMPLPASLELQLLRKVYGGLRFAPPTLHSFHVSSGVPKEHELLLMEGGLPPVIVGSSRSIVEMNERILRIAPSLANVLIVGECGTGKELVAQAIHRYCARSKGPFVAINCAALPEQLVESELFGHERGAFTGATAERPGKFEQAQGGTLLLDEIGEMSLSAQGKLLRVLQQREIQRIGGRSTIKLDVRIVCATNKDLKKAVLERVFREDLYYRIKVCVVSVPSLRDHKDDIPILVEHFLKKYRRLYGRRVHSVSRGALEVLANYPFPGNVRELENLTESAVVMAKECEITVADLPDELREYSSPDEQVDGCGRKYRRLLAALSNLTAGSDGGPANTWGTTLRCTTVEALHAFLVNTRGRAFTRMEFAAFLCCRNERDRYGTAGRYLRRLTQGGILLHNQSKANRVRYKVSEAYLQV